MPGLSADAFGSGSELGNAFLKAPDFDIRSSDILEARLGALTGDFPRVFSGSRDPLVDDVANAVEESSPGLVADTNTPVFRPDGSDLGDYDIDLQTAVIEVKSGSGTGAGRQVTNLLESELLNDRVVIVYGPNLSNAVVAEVENRGGLAVRDLQDLIELVRP